jgi:sec-independent protein translocase protein TatB
MFEVGFTELLVIFGLALIVLGPHKLPEIASQIGRWIGRARAMARQLREQLDQEVKFDDARPERESPPRSRTQAAAESPPEPHPEMQTPNERPEP